MKREDRRFWRRVLLVTWLFWFTAGIAVGRNL